MELTPENIQQLLTPAKMANHMRKELAKNRINLLVVASRLAIGTELDSAQNGVRYSERKFYDYAFMVGNLIKQIEE